MRWTILAVVFLFGCSSTPNASDGSAGTDGGTSEDGAVMNDDSSGDTGADSAEGNDGASMNDDSSRETGVDSGPPCTANADTVGLITRTVEGSEYVSYAPSSYVRGKPMPLVVALHGAGGTAQKYLNAIWKGNADTKGFVVIAPEGTSPLGNGFTYYPDDRTLILAEIDDIRSCYDLDPKKTILNGFSAGGIMAYWIGLKDAERFSGIGINSSDLSTAEYGPNGGVELIPAPWTIPVSHFHGDQDANFPIQYAKQGVDRLAAAGHKTYWHPFTGGHTASAPMAAQEYDDLISSSSP
jgi:poly(3-hydroxybutyrate) depolymerase